MKNILSGITGALWILALYGCTDTEPVVEQKPKEAVFQGYIDVLEKAKEVNRTAETRATHQNKVIEEQSK